MTPTSLPRVAELVRTSAPNKGSADASRNLFMAKHFESGALKAIVVRHSPIAVIRSTANRRETLHRVGRRREADEHIFRNDGPLGSR